MTPEKILLRPELLDEIFVPEILHGREEHLKQLRKCFAPALEGKKPLHALLVGPSGSGKTVLAKNVLQTLANSDVPTAYVNCWDHDTLYSILDKIVQELGILGAEKIDATIKMQAIEKHLGKRPFIIMLDEAHRLLPKDRNDVLYSLSSIGNIGLFCISSDKHFFESLEDQVKSRLYPTLVEFPPYEEADVIEILRHRCEKAFAEGTIGQKHLEYLGAQAAGNARIALQILRKAASFAEQEGKRRLTKNHIKQASIASNSSRKEYLLSQNEHFRIIYEIIKANPGIMSGRLWKAYGRADPVLCCDSAHPG